MRTYQGVIFDMDGLLFDTETVYMEVNVRLAPNFGLIGLDEAYMLGLVGLSDAECFERYQRDFSVTIKTLVAFVEAGHQEVKKLFASGQVPVKPGVYQLLDFLKEKQLPCVIASSNLREFITILLEVNQLSSYFKGIVSADDVKRAKPDPEIVVKATELLGLEAHACLMLEDSLNGVCAAYSAGVDVIVVPDLVAPTKEMQTKAKAIVTHLEEVQAFL